MKIGNVALHTLVTLITLITFFLGACDGYVEVYENGDEIEYRAAGDTDVEVEDPENFPGVGWTCEESPTSPDVLECQGDPDLAQPPPTAVPWVKQDFSKCYWSHGEKLCKTYVCWLCDNLLCITCDFAGYYRPGYPY